MAFNLDQANSQWSTRPADQRFWTLEEAHQFCKGYADTATEHTLDFGVEAIRALPDGNIGVTMDDRVGAVACLEPTLTAMRSGKQRGELQKLSLCVRKPWLASFFCVPHCRSEE